MPRNMTSHQVVHKHYHYHYYPQRESPYQNPQKSLVNTSITPKKNQRFDSDVNDFIYMENDPTNSWKKHINPQITRMYQEISINESFNQDFSGSNSYAFDRGNNENLKSQLKPKQGTTKQQELKQYIQRYQRYLKKRSKTNLFVPGTKSMINLRNIDFNSNDRQNQLKNQSQIQKMYRKKKMTQNIQNMVMQKEPVSEVKKSKQEFSTFLTNQISAIKTLKQQEQEKQDLTKTLKNQKKRSAKQINNMKETIGQKQRQIRSAQNLQINVPKITKPSEFLFNSFNTKDFQKEKQILANFKEQNNEIYRYKLLEEECIYLRDHFMHHVEQNHKQEKTTNKQQRKQKKQ